LIIEVNLHSIVTGLMSVASEKVRGGEIGV